MGLLSSGPFWLTLGAGLSLVAAILHIAIIVGGADWYRFFGAGEQMAQAVEAGKLFPHIVTAGIAVILTIWALFALSGVAIFPRLPLLKPALVAITCIYIARGVLFPLFANVDAYSVLFIRWSSLICLGFGVVHLIGVVKMWSTL